MRDRIVHATHLTARGIGAAGRDVAHRAYGTAASIRSAWRRDEVEDDVLVERVRARAGRLVSHSHALHVTANDGIVSVSGPILEHEAWRLLRGVRQVRGVRDVIDQLEVHKHATGIPALQGGRVPPGDRPDVLRESWAPATRVVVGAAGAGIAAIGLAQRNVWGTLGAVAGALMCARAAVNVPLDRLTGIGSRRRAVDLQKTITINAPVGEVYAFWSLYENFPRFMSRVLDVRSSERRPMESHWKVAGPAGAPVEFDAEVTEAIPNQLIAWKTLPGSPLGHAGIVRFDPEGAQSTRVHIRMSYTPPAGWLGHSIAAAFGVDPKHSMDADLARMKTLIETGRAPHDAAQRNDSV
jgi:uncharacterized membrane protein